MATVTQRQSVPLRPDLANEWVWQGEQRLDLTPKAFAVLRYLMDHPGRVVTKEELLREGWPDTVVSEWVLTTCIRKIRQALGEEALVIEGDAVRLNPQAIECDVMSFDAAIRHQGVEIHRVPPARVDADAGNAELIGDLDALVRVLDVLADNFRFRTDKILVGREADQIDPVREGEAFQPVAISASRGVERRLFLEVHLPVQNVHSADADAGGFLDHRFDGNFRRTEMPVGISGNAELDVVVARCVSGCGLRSEGEGGGAARCGAEKSPAGKVHGERSCKRSRDVSLLKSILKASLN